MLDLALFVGGFYLLIRGAGWLVDGASALARKLGINNLLIGLTVVAFGTSLPELIVNLFANQAGNADLAIGNVLGSNIANTLLILGVAAMIHPLAIKRLTVYREILFNVLAAGMLIVLVADAWIIGDTSFLGLDRIDGLVLISYFFIFMFYIFGRTNFAAQDPKLPTTRSGSSRDVPRFFLMIAVGSLALYFGGRWIVDGALHMANFFGIEESIIGLSLVAIGTSLPELAASITAVRRKNVDIAVGNVVGSNLFNLLWVLGLSATLRPLSFTSIEVMDAVVGLAVAAALFFSVAYGRYKHQISRFEARLFLTAYTLYLITLPFR